VTAEPAESAAGARRAELAANLAAVEQRLRAACADAGRDRGEVTLVAVTKTFPASDVRLLAELGVTDVAENRDQEARGKAAECAPDLAPECADLRWHFVGQLQRNKARSVVRYADVVHSVDRAELVDALATAARKLRPDPLDVLLQVNLDPAGDPDRPGAPRGGVSVEEAASLAAVVAAESALRLRGVMAVAPRDGDPEEAFARLARVAAGLRHAHPHAAWISAGMSGDLESAIRQGATHVRVGTALLGGRPRLRGTVAR
jgi:pyridoxal phosphate enzyme (YggS family)